MPMDTPRVPSDEFELALLEKINSNGKKSLYDLANIVMIAEPCQCQ